MPLPQHNKLYDLLESKVAQFNHPDFIKNDPISIPHQFSKLQDIEIMGFWAAMLAWGLRKTIINKSQQLVKLMDGAPHDFILNHQENDLKPFLEFKHRTFNAIDTLYFIQFFKQYYQKNDSLQTAFTQHLSPEHPNIEAALIGFQQSFFALENAPRRTQKHVATPARKSTCKRLCMFLRWMVRQDDKGVDFGIWKNINMSQLICPLDVHVDRIARQYGLIERKQTDWKTSLELTQNLHLFDANDPVKYDFALFGMGVMEKRQLG